MTLQQFIDKYNGKKIDYDGFYGAQCMDLYRQYVKEVLEFPQSPGVEGAKDVWDTYLKDKYTRVSNTPDGVPEAGDIVIWGIGAGTYGHIAIFIEGTTGSFKSFDQNWPVGSSCHIQGHYYSNVLGWLKPIKQEVDMITDEQKRILDFIGDRSEGDVREAFGALTDFKPLQEKVKRLETEIGELKIMLESTKVDILNLQESLVASQKAGQDYQTQLESANKQNTKLLKQIETKDFEISEIREVSNKYQRLYKEALEKSVEKLTVGELFTLLIKKIGGFNG